MVTLAAVPSVERAPGLRPWPRTWLERQLLLERQHDRLEALLADLLSLHVAEASAWRAVDALACDDACRRLLWDLRLHLRLEERWLQAEGCLCSGHRAAHAQAARAAFSAFVRSAGDRQARGVWLRNLSDWFTAHRAGPDATAYAAATAATAAAAVSSATASSATAILASQP